MEAKYSKWRKLDNAALAFPMVTGKDDTRVFRFYCELKETVDETTLQEALDQTMKTYPLFQAVLRKGLFWFYLEHREIRPVVREETKPPCSSTWPKRRPPSMAVPVPPPSCSSGRPLPLGMALSPLSWPSGPARSA